LSSIKQPPLSKLLGIDPTLQKKAAPFVGLRVRKKTNTKEQHKKEKIKRK
jgi:hypothetical protein